MGRHQHHGKRHHVVPQTNSPALIPRALPVSVNRLPFLQSPQDPTVVKRSPADSTSENESESTSCGPDDTTGPCERVGDTTLTRTLPIALGVAIPVTVIIIVLIFLHRRHIKRLRNEDANDKHKSLDFGLDVVPRGGKGGKNGKGGRGLPATAEMSKADTEKSLRRGGHGMSMDLALANPYLLPPGLQGSKESLHSLTRSFHTDDDKYRPATAVAPGDNGSLRSFGHNHRPGVDDSSSFTGSSSRQAHRDEMSHNLLWNAQRMSKSPPPPPAPAHLADHSNPVPRESPMAPYPNAYDDHHHDPYPDAGAPKSNDYPAGFVNPDSPPPSNPGLDHPPPRGASLPTTTESAEPPTDPTPMPTLPTVLPPSPSHDTKNPLDQPLPSLPRISLTLEDDDGSDYGDNADMPAQPALPEVNVHLAEPQNDSAGQRVSVGADDIFDQYLEPDPRRMTMGLRPLPPDDPSDNPEQRANRIRSFYKEYFDDSKPFNEEDYYGDYGVGDDYGYGDYGDYGDYGYEDPLPQPPPFAQPVGRRAMTPPPRMPPRFGPGPRNDGAASAFGFHGGPGHRAFGSMSSGPGPRAFSSASNRGPGMMPRKPMPPPAPLHELPTPHKLKEDNMILPIDYAPGAGAKERRAGRPETPLGGLRPYTPAVPSHSPLASSHDDLAVMPSPHTLRKSGTFTALDFAPPPRFRNEETASDGGSIRSNRTGLSTAQSYSIRSGAARVSRLPPQTVGTKDDITSNLRPTWGMHR